MAERGNSFNRWLDRFVGIPLTACCALLRAGKKPLAGVQPQRVGFICLGAIGDLLLLSALISALRDRLPQAHFSLLTSRANAATVGLIPGIDESAAFRVSDLPAMAAWLRAQRLDVLLDSSQWARLGAVLSNLSHAAVTVGFATEGQHRALGYTCKVPHRADRHEVENFLDLGRALYPDLTGKPQLLLPQTPPTDLLHDLAQDLPDATAEALADAPGHGLTATAMLDDPAGVNARGGAAAADAATRGRIFLHMWPSGIHAWLKEWPAAYWDELARLLAEKGFAVYLTGGPADAARNNAFLRAHPQCPAVSLAGKTSLAALTWLFARAAAVVSVNTGTMHLAALAGAPTVGLHGPTNPLRWGPVGRHVRALLPHEGPYAYLNLGFEYPRPHRPCLGSLPVEDVADALHSMSVF